MNNKVTVPFISLIIGLGFGALIGVSIPTKDKCAPTEDDYKRDVKVVQPIDEIDYLDFELEPVNAKNFLPEDEAPLFMLEGMIKNSVFQHYKDRSNVRKTIDDAKADNKITFSEYMQIRKSVRDEFIHTRDKEDRAALNKLVKGL